MENIAKVKITELHPFPNHPFQVRDDDAMRETVESVREYGVLSPVIVRTRDEGGYEIISGQRRTRACEIAGIGEIPVIIRDMDYDSAVITLVDSNIKSEVILPSEKAAAYKMKLEAIKHQGKRTSEQLAPKLSTEEIGEAEGISKDTVKRFIRLTELEPELMKMVDDGKMAMTPAVEISYLKPEEQKLLIDTIESEQSMPSFSQAKRIKEMSREGTLNDDSILEVMTEQKKPEKIEIVLPYESLAKYFPKSYTPHQMERMIYKLLGAGRRRNSVSRVRDKQE